MLNKEHLNQFFGDIKHILSDAPPVNMEGKTELTTQVNDQSGDQRTNVIYLNTDCNLRCDYCYEGDSREGLPDQVNLTTEGIDEFLQEVAEREPDVVSTIVIMGGEPFLRFDLVQYIIAKSIEIPKSKGWGIALITNGTLFTPKRIEKFKKLLDLCDRSNSKTSLSLEISYDASGQDRRKWPDGSSSRQRVEECLDNLVANDILFKISYVVHGGNCNNIIEDIVRIFERWPSVQRLILSYAYEDLDNAFKDREVGQKLQKTLRPYFAELYKIYKKPICQAICGLCQICYKGNFVGNSYLSPTTGISYDVKKTEHLFQQF